MTKTRDLEIDNYLNQLADERKAILDQLRQIFKEHLPIGFEERFLYGMISYVVPHTRYAKGYHVNPDQPLPFISMANQKNHIALYHYGLYASPSLMTWFKDRYQAQSKHKIDLGKSCIRFKYLDEIPFNLIKELATKISVDAWIQLYEKGRNL